MAQGWMVDYNRYRPYEALANLTPLEVLERYNQS